MPSYQDEDEDDYDYDDEDEEYDFDEEEDDDKNRKPITMSANLMAALGMDVSKEDTTTDWKPPSRPGLQYSERIVPEYGQGGFKRQIFSIDDDEFEGSRLYKHYNDIVGPSKGSDRKAKRVLLDNESDDSDDEEEDRPVYLTSNLMNILGLKDSKNTSHTDKSASWQPPRTHGLSNHATRDNDSDENDDDEDYDEDEDEDDFDRKPIIMSANLMAALGMDVSKEDTTTDWKPPSRPGLQYSERIIKGR